MYSKYKREMSNSSNPIVLITGGSSGIGLAMAHEFAIRKFNLLLVSNQTDVLTQCKVDIESKYGIDCHVFSIDMTKKEAAMQIFEFCKDRQLEVDILVNNAGILVFSEVVETPLQKLESILQLHIQTPTALCKLFGEQMKAKHIGHILNVSSISAVMPYPGISLYGPSKTYMRYFSKAFRSEMKRYNVNVTCLIPGATETALYDPNRVNLKLAKQLGVMQTAEVVAQKAIRAMFNKKGESVPGWLNKLTVVALPLIPSGVIEMIHKHSNILQKGNKALG